MRIKKVCVGGLLFSLMLVPVFANRASAQAGLVPRASMALAPGVNHLTMVDLSPRNVVHVARIANGARLTIKAVPAATVKGTALARPAAICTAVKAIVCINGDMFGRGGVPVGGVLADGRWARQPTNVQTQLWVDQSNHFSFGAQPAGAVQSLGATKYALVRNGKSLPIPERSAFANGRYARTLVGWNGAGDSFFVTVDKGPNSRGMSLAEAARLMLKLGATNAVNEDGGSSTQFIVGPTLSNAPTSGQRSVANVWAVVPK